MDTGPLNRPLKLLDTVLTVVCTLDTVLSFARPCQCIFNLKNQLANHQYRTLSYSRRGHNRRQKSNLLVLIVSTHCHRTRNECCRLSGCYWYPSSLFSQFFRMRLLFEKKNIRKIIFHKLISRTEASWWKSSPRWWPVYPHKLPGINRSIDMMNFVSETVRSLNIDTDT